MELTLAKDKPLIKQYIIISLIYFQNYSFGLDLEKIYKESIFHDITNRARDSIPAHNISEVRMNK